MPYKVYNPDPVEFKVKVHDTELHIPAKSYVIVSSVRGLVDNFPALEITPASDEAYEEFRKEQAELQKEAEKKAKEFEKAESHRIKEEAKKTEKKIKDRKEKESKARAEETKHKLGAVIKEQEEVEHAEETIAVDTTIAPVKVAKSPKKSKKGK